MTSSMLVGFKQTEPMTVVFILKRGPYSQIPKTFGELYAWTSAKGYQPSAPPSGVYFNAPGQVPDEELLWELRVPIAGQVTPSESDEAGVGVKHLEPMLVAFAMHKGPYESIDSTYYQSLITWITENGYEVVGPGEEVYFSPPETPAEEVLTEVRFPVKKRQG